MYSLRTCTKYIWCSYYRTLASEVKCRCVIERRDLSNEQNTFKSKTIFYHKRTRLKPERATRPIPKRRRPLYATATTQILNLSNLTAKRQRYQEDVEENRAAKRQRYQEDVEENRAAKRQKYEDNSAAIKASERNRYWNDPAVRLSKRAAERKRYRRGHRTTTTTQRYVMACCIALALKSYRKMCMQHVYSTHVRDLHKTIHFTCKAHA